MTFTSQTKFSNSNTITITLASLADGAVATSSTIDNSTNKFITADIQIKTRTSTGTSSIGGLTLFFLRSADGGTTFDSVGSGNLEILAAYTLDSDSTDYRFSAETSRLGLLPDFWRIAVQNDSGAALDSTASNHSVEFSGKKFEFV